MAKRSKTPPRDLRRTVLDNGVRVITDRVPEGAATFVSVWVDAGSRYEELNESGSTHLIQRLALEGGGVVESIDAVGGDVRLETGRDFASYAARVEPKAAPDALALLAELALRPNILGVKPASVRERLLEELRAAEHEPDFVLERMFLRSLWKGHGLCRPPRGRLLTVRNHTRLADLKPKKLAKFHEMSHHPAAITVVAAGKLSHSKIAKAAKKLFGDLTKPKKTVSTSAPATQRFVAIKNRAEFPRIRIMLGVEACSAADPRAASAGVLKAVIGGRVAALVRDGELPAIEASAILEGFADTGCLAVKLRAERRDAQQAYERTVAELRALSMGEISDDEVERARATRRNRVLGELDSPAARAQSLAAQERYHGGALELDEQLERIAAVSTKQVARLASEWFQPYTLSVAALGRLDGVRLGSPSSCW